MAHKEKSPEQQDAELEAAAIEELSKLAPPEPVAFELSDGRSIELRPIVGEQFGAFAKAVSPIRRAAANVAAGNVTESDEDFLDLMNDNADSIYTVISLASGISASDVAEFMPGDLLWLWQISVRVNRDFFSRSLLASSIRNREAIKRVFGMDDQTPPDGSRSPAS